MKITVDKALKVVAQLRLLGEHKSDETTTVPAIAIPAEKSSTGYWIGRLQDKLEGIEKRYNTQIEKHLKQFGKPAKMKNEAGVEVEIANQYTLDAKAFEEKNTADQGVLNQEEDIEFLPLSYELFVGINFPASFWGQMGALLTEPK